ncbi:MAG TPA: O-antigen ligase family protein [Bacteroidales bacterium]|nr:O-antigen ligase family protein [Bacteroidales bacterium]
MTEKSKLIWVYLISGLYILFNSYLLINHLMWGAAVPILLIITLLYFVAIDKVILMITFFTPIAINIENLDVGAAISLPTEPLMFGVLVFFLIKILHDGTYDLKIIKHPLTVFIFINLLWLLFTSITSEMPVVSFKFLLSRLWFLIPFYFFIILLFKNKATIKTFLWMYIIPLIGVILYTIIHHSVRGLDEESGHWVMRPFYNDHTAYGAVLTLYTPVLVALMLDRTYSMSSRVVITAILVLFLIALVLSYSRAAWLSLAISLVIFVLIYLRIKFRYVFVSTVVVVGLFFTFQQQIFDKLERNKQDSSANFIEHIQSITNISSDASNLERINRWQSAFRMFDERPFWGWGPGTYQFIYAPFQRAKEKTIISTNAGDMGNAHSEYIGPLAESGVFGMISVFLIFATSIVIGIRVYRQARTRELKLLSISVLIGLISYYLHGFLNNFLNSDKASVPVWGFMAILVAIDIYHNQNHEDEAVVEENATAQKKS